MNRRWTVADDRLLLELYRSVETRAAIAARLNRSADAIDARRRHLRCPARSEPTREWRAIEDAFMRNASAARVPSSEIAIYLGRTTYAVRRRRQLLAATQPAARRYRVDEDAAIAAAVAAGRSLAVLAQELRRTEGALRLRAKNLGLITHGSRRRWTRAEDERLRAGYANGLSTSQIRDRHLPDRSQGAIVARAHLLGIAVHARRWTADEERRLEWLLAAGASTRIIRRALGRSDEAIRNRCRRLGLAPPPSGRPLRHRPWTGAEDELLRERHDEHVAVLAASLRRSQTAVRRRLRRLGIPRRERSQHHPFGEVSRRHAEERLIARELPLTPVRALNVSRRLGVPLAELHRIAGQIGAPRSHAGRIDLPKEAQGAG